MTVRKAPRKTAKRTTRKKTAAAPPLVDSERYSPLPGILPGIRKDIFKRAGSKIGGSVSRKISALDVRIYRKLHGYSRDKGLEDMD
jgi:hypothetical protein